MYDNASLGEVFYKPFLTSQININQPPIANAGPDQNVTVNQTVYFNGSGSIDPDGDKLTYNWSFGDGNYTGWQSDCNSTHKYSSSGTYTAILSVNDGVVTNNDSCTINISLASLLGPKILLFPNTIELDEDFGTFTQRLTAYESHANLDFVGDLLKWYVTGNSGTLFHITGDNSTGSHADTFTFTSKQDKFGIENLTFHLWDPNKLEHTIDQTIIVKPVNDKPILKLPSNTFFILYDQEDIIDFSMYITDVDNDKSELTLSTDDSEHITPDGLKLKFNYPSSMQGQTQIITLFVSDGVDEVKGNFNIQISDNNRPRLVKELPQDHRIQSGEKLVDDIDLDEYFSDPDGDILTYTYEAEDIIITIDKHNEVTFEAPNDVDGGREIWFTVKDPFGAFSQGIMQITLVDVNDPPTIKAIPDINVHYVDSNYPGYSYDFSYFVTDPDDDRSELTFWVSVVTSETDDAWIKHHPEYHLWLIFKFPISAEGRHPLYLNVMDPDGAIAYRLFNLTVVLDEIPVEQLRLFPDKTFYEKPGWPDKIIDAFNLEDYYQNLDETGTNYQIWSIPNAMIKANISTENALNLNSIDEDWYGVEEVVIVAIDNSPLQYVYSIVKVTVIPVNDPPVFGKELPKLTVNLNEEYMFDLTEFITDVDTPLSSLIVNIDDYDHVKVISGLDTVVIKYDKEGNYNTVVTISDGESTVSSDLKITVIDPDNGIIPPERIDTDNDGIPDIWEIKYNLDPNDPNDASLDYDNDSLTNLQEYKLDTDPRDHDTDDDGYPDNKDDYPTDPKRYKKKPTSGFDYTFVIIAVVAIIIILIILASLKIFIFKSKSRRVRRSYSDDELLNQVRHKILHGEKLDELDISHDELERLLEWKFRNGQLSEGSYQFIKASILDKKQPPQV